MPLYEYQCAKCGRKSEFIQSFSDPHETKCPHCGGALKKLLSSPAFQFKGSGFYATDYGKSGESEKSEKGEEKISPKGEEGSGGAEKGEKGEKGEKSEKSEKSEEKKISSKGEEGSGRSESKGDSAGAESARDSSKGKKDGDPGAAPTSPSGRSSPVPSKKKKGDRK
jgi:putative FmdB family regulatory protein